MPATVLSVRPVTPSVVRLQVVWDPGRALRRSGRSDEALLVGAPLPAAGGVPSDRRRWYTVREVDDERRHLTLDVVLHGGGAVSGWVEQAVPGDRLELAPTTTGWYDPPPDTTWQLLAGDLTALPAMARILEATGRRLRTRVLVEVADAGDESYLADVLGQAQGGQGAQGAQAVPAPHVSCLQNRHLASGSRLGDAVRSLGGLLPGPGGASGSGYVYVAGEGAASRAVRRHLRHVVRLPPTRYAVIGYWTVDSERWRWLWERHGDELAALYAGIDEPGADAEAVRDRYDARLDELVGLTPPGLTPPGLTPPGRTASR